MEMAKTTVSVGPENAAKELSKRLTEGGKKIADNAVALAKKARSNMLLEDMKLTSH